MAGLRHPEFHADRAVVYDLHAMVRQMYAVHQLHVRGVMAPKPISIICIPDRAEKVLLAAGVETIGDIMSLGSIGLRRIKGIGPVTTKAIDRELGEYGLSLPWRTGQ